MPRSTPNIAIGMMLLIVAFTLSSCAPTPTPTPVPLDPTAARPRATLGPVLGPVVPTATQPATESKGPTPTTGVIQQSKPVPPAAGDAAYVFSGQDLEGNTHSLADFRGKKVMLNFWASWCGPCQAEIPHMVALYREMAGEDFEIVAVNLREPPDKVAAFVEDREMEFVVLLDESGSIGQSYFVRAIPTSIFIDEKGNIQAVHMGTLTDELLRQYVSDLMGS